MKIRRQLSDVSGRQKSEATRETRANADRERTVTDLICRASAPLAFLAEQFTRFRQRVRDLAGVLASALRVLRASAAFSAYNGRDLLDQFVRLKLRRQR